MLDEENHQAANLNGQKDSVAFEAHRMGLLALSFSTCTTSASFLASPTPWLHVYNGTDNSTDFIE